MPRFFLDVKDENNIIISGNDAHHISKSLRMKIGEEITVTHHGIDYFCKIRDITSDNVYLNLIFKKQCKSEPSVNVTLYQAMPKGEKFKTIVQKTIELGVNRIVPVITRRCIARPTEKDFAKKLDRYAKICEAAAKQSGRGIIPQVVGLISFEKAIKEMRENDVNLILYENGGQRFSKELFTDKKNIGVFIGSEGGFDEEEVELAKNSGAIPIWLGERILRCETAPLAAITIIMHLTENL